MASEAQPVVTAPTVWQQIEGIFSAGAIKSANNLVNKIVADKPVQPDAPSKQMVEVRVIPPWAWLAAGVAVSALLLLAFKK